MELPSKLKAKCKLINSIIKKKFVRRLSGLIQRPIGIAINYERHSTLNEIEIKIYCSCFVAIALHRCRSFSPAFRTGPITRHSLCKSMNEKCIARCVPIGRVWLWASGSAKLYSTFRFIKYQNERRPLTTGGRQQQHQRIQKQGQWKISVVPGPVNNLCPHAIDGFGYVLSDRYLVWVYCVLYV